MLRFLGLLLYEIAYAAEYLGGAKMEFIPMKEKILIRPNKAEEKTAGGIYIPESAKEKSQEGTVVAVAQEGCEPIKKGDVVVYENYAGSDIELDGEKHMILKVKDVLGIIRT